jgi:hypothetical protein
MKRTIGLLLLLSLGCDGGGTHEPQGGKPSGSWIGLKAALEHPGAVDAWTIAGDPRKGSYFDYPESSKRIPVDTDAAASLSAILSDPKSFSGNPKGCIPVPGVKIRFSRTGLDPVWLFFCFDCEELFIYEGFLERESKEIDPSTKKLVALMKKIFPKSSSIQSLK